MEQLYNSAWHFFSHHRVDDAARLAERLEAEVWRLSKDKKGDWSEKAADLLIRCYVYRGSFILAADAVLYSGHHMHLFRHLITLHDFCRRFLLSFFRRKRDEARDSRDSITRYLEQKDAPITSATVLDDAVQGARLVTKVTDYLEAIMAKGITHEDEFTFSDRHLVPQNDSPDGRNQLLSEYLELARHWQSRDRFVDTYETQRVRVRCFLGLKRYNEALGLLNSMQHALPPDEFNDHRVWWHCAKTFTLQALGDPIGAAIVRTQGASGFPIWNLPEMQQERLLVDCDLPTSPMKMVLQLAFFLPGMNKSHLCDSMFFDICASDLLPRLWTDLSELARQTDKTIHEDSHASFQRIGQLQSFIATEPKRVRALDGLDETTFHQLRFWPMSSALLVIEGALLEDEDEHHLSADFAIASILSHAAGKEGSGVMTTLDQYLFHDCKLVLTDKDAYSVVWSESRKSWIYRIRCRGASADTVRRLLYAFLRTPWATHEVLYAGHGVLLLGDWLLADGVLHFEELERALVHNRNSAWPTRVLLNCCYSHVWKRRWEELYPPSTMFTEIVSASTPEMPVPSLFAGLFLPQCQHRSSFQSAVLTELSEFVNKHFEGTIPSAPDKMVNAKLQSFIEISECGRLAGPKSVKQNLGLLRKLSPPAQHCDGVYPFPAGQGDCTLVRLGQWSILIDGGMTLPSLAQHAWKTIRDLAVIDVMVLTHYDSDHANGIQYILTRLDQTSQDERAQYLVPQVRELWLNHAGDLELVKSVKNNGRPAGICREILVKASRLEIPCLPIVAWTPQQMQKQVREKTPNRHHKNDTLFSLPDRFSLKELIDAAKESPRLVILNPPPFDQDVNPSNPLLLQHYQRWEKANQKATSHDRSGTKLSLANLCSAVLLISYKGWTGLFTGDAYCEDIIKGLECRGLLKKNDNDHISLDYMDLPHHGSDKNSNKQFFKRVRAKTYVISTDGSYDHPGEETFSCLLKAYKQTGRNEPIKIIGTYRQELKYNKLTDLIKKLEIDSRLVTIQFGEAFVPLAAHGDQSAASSPSAAAAGSSYALPAAPPASSATK